MKKRLAVLLSVCCLMAAFSLPAAALEYTFDAPNAGLFGQPTSVEVHLYIPSHDNVRQEANAP